MHHIDLLLIEEINIYLTEPALDYTVAQSFYFAVYCQRIHTHSVRWAPEQYDTCSEFKSDVKSVFLKYSHRQRWGRREEVQNTHNFYEKM